jgi:hypothetical protein
VRVWQTSSSVRYAATAQTQLMCSSLLYMAHTRAQHMTITHAAPVGPPGLAALVHLLCCASIA